MSKPKTPREVLLMLFRRKTLFLLAAAFFAIIVLWGSHWMPLKYTASATFERSSGAGENEKDNMGFFVLKPLLYVRLAGPMVLAEALKTDEVGLTKNFPRNPDGTLTAEGQAKLEQLIRDITPNLKVNMSTNSDLIDVVIIEFTHSDPNVAEQLPTTLFNMYKESTINELQERLDVAINSMRKELAVEATKLKDANTKKTRFEIENKDFMLDKPTGLQDQTELINRELDRIERYLKDEQDSLALYQSLQNGTDDTTASGDEVAEYSMIPNPKLDQLQDELKRAKDGLDNAKIAGMLPNHPTYQRVERTIVELEKRIAEEPKMIRDREVFRPRGRQVAGTTNPLEIRLLDVRRRIESLTREQADLIERKTRINKLIDNSLKVRQDYLTLCGDVTKARESVEQLEKQLFAVEASFRAEVAKRRTTIRMVQPPQKQHLPSSPKLPIVILMALAGGLGFGGVLVFLANSVDRTIGTTDEAMRHFNLTLHGAVGEIDTPKDRSWRFFRRWVITPIVIGIVLIVIGVSCMDVMLRLKYPQKYARWQKAPVTFVMEELGGSSGKL